MRILNIGDLVSFEGETGIVKYSYCVRRKLDIPFQEYIIELPDRRIIINHQSLKDSGAYLERE